MESQGSKRSGKYLDASQQMAMAPTPEMRAYTIRCLALSGFLRNAATKYDVIAQAAPPAMNSIRFVVGILDLT